MPIALVINGQNRTFPNLVPPVTLTQLIAEMSLMGDRIAIEHNGKIAQHARWDDVPVFSGDRLEIVHFVGGGGV